MHAPHDRFQLNAHARRAGICVGRIEASRLFLGWTAGVSSTSSVSLPPKDIRNNILHCLRISQILPGSIKDSKFRHHTLLGIITFKENSVELRASQSPKHTLSERKARTRFSSRNADSHKTAFLNVPAIRLFIDRLVRLGMHLRMSLNTSCMEIFSASGYLSGSTCALLQIT